MLYLGSMEWTVLEANCVIKGTILQRNYRKMTIPWSFFYNSFVKFHGKINWSHNMTVLYPKVSEYDQEIPQSHTADQPMAPRGRATEHLH